MKTTPMTTAVRGLILALTASAVSFTGISSAQLINVNFNGFTGGNLQSEVEETLEGPAGGLNTRWNQYADEDSAGIMVDSDGNDTTVTFTTTFSEGRTGSTGNLPVFRSTLTDFAKGIQSRNLTVTGLEPNGFYNIWILAYRDNGGGAERLAGTWTTANSTTSASSQAIDSVTTRNGDTFEDGVNYALFENVEADGTGTIVFNAAARLGPDPLVSTDDYRLGLSGFQLEKTIPVVAGAVDANVSTVTASPDIVFADGSATSTVTVTLKDAAGVGVSGREVSLANTAGPGSPVITPPTTQITASSGVATFTVSSATPGVEEFTATDVTDANLVITQTASVEFVEVGVLADAAMSTVEASPVGVLADGIATSAITVTLIDANGFPVAGKDVTLANTFGPGTPVISPVGAQATDGSGAASFTVSSSTIGVEEFTATDTTDSMVVTQIASVGFLDPNAPTAINVNFEQFTPALGTPEDEVILVGPAGGLNTTWNQFADEDSAEPLVSSAGLATTVEFTTDFSESRAGGGGNTPMLRSTLTDFARGAERTLTITGLVADAYYDVWLASFRGSASAVERTVGVWSTSNVTTSPPSQIIDNRLSNDGTAFVEGTNYVLFEFVQADGSGQIVFDGKAATIATGFDADYRVGLSGFQLVETDAPLARIVSFGVPGIAGVIDEVAKTISLEVPFGTNLATLAPEFTLTTGTSNQTSGAPPSPTFAAANPVDYVVTDTSTDPDTVQTYSVAVTVAPAVGTIVIDLGASPVGTQIEGGTFGTYGATNLPLPALPPGSILRSLAINAVLEATDNENFASDLAVLLDPTPGTPGGDFSVEITNGTGELGGALQLGWPALANAGPGTPLVDTKTDIDWAAAGPIDLNTTGLFLGNAYGGPIVGGTWSGTITLTYDIAVGGNDFSDWIGGFGLAPGAQGFSDDPDSDNLDSGVEAFFGTDPSEFSAGLTQVSTTGAVTTFQHPEADPPLGDVSGSYEWSLDLQTWNASGATVSGTTVTIPEPPAPVAGITTVTATASGTIPATLFLRAVAVQAME